MTNELGRETVSGKYKERTERQWFVRDVRGAHHQVSDENEARDLVAENPAAQGVVLWRDVTYGPMVVNVRDVTA